MGPRVSVDYADVAVDPTPPVCDSRQHLVTDQWATLVRVDLDLPVDLPTSHRHHADWIRELKIWRKECEDEWILVSPTKR